MHSASEAADDVVVVEAGQAIWNPLAVACWSVVFTPAFGAYLLMRNWQTLGESRQAALARVWFCFSLGLLGVQLLSAAINRRLNSESNLMDWLGLLYLAAGAAGAQSLRRRRLPAQGVGPGAAVRGAGRACLLPRARRPQLPAAGRHLSVTSIRLRGHRCPPYVASMKAR
jgi:hypothetical protein